MIYGLQLDPVGAALFGDYLLKKFLILGVKTACSLAQPRRRKKHSTEKPTETMYKKIACLTREALETSFQI